MGIYHVGVVLRTIRNLRQIFQCWFEPRENCIVIATHKANRKMGTEYQPALMITLPPILFAFVIWHASRMKPLHRTS